MNSPTAFGSWRSVGTVLSPRTVLEHWGIHETEDVGRVVFAMVEQGILVKEDEDDQQDFTDLFDFEEAFEREYPWSAHP